jgi:hypothetical protein
MRRTPFSSECSGARSAGPSAGTLEHDREPVEPLGTVESQLEAPADAVSPEDVLHLPRDHEHPLDARDRAGPSDDAPDARRAAATGARIRLERLD